MLCAFAAGICCVIIGVIVVLMDVFFNERLFEFFNVDLTHDLDEFVLSESSSSSSSLSSSHSHVAVCPSKFPLCFLS